MKKKIIWISCLLLIIVCILGVFFLFKEEDNTIKLTDAQKFGEEYGITEDNVFVYRSFEEIIKILENGSGIIYLGFPECPWCKGYVPYLNEVAKKEQVDKIYYFNILEDRQNNSENYKKCIDLLDKYLKYDEEGNKRIYVPAVIAVNKGEIVGFNDETSYDTKGYETPKEYWENEDLDGLKETLSKMMIASTLEYCSDCNK